jgi:hypothetical protein
MVSGYDGLTMNRMTISLDGISQGLAVPGTPRLQLTTAGAGGYAARHPRSDAGDALNFHLLLGGIVLDLAIWSWTFVSLIQAARLG